MAKKITVKIKKVPLYPTRLGVIIGGNEKEVMQFLKKEGVPDYLRLDFDNFDALTITEGVCKDEKGEERFCIYVIFDPKNKKFTHGIIAHEVRHITNSILNRIGHVLDAENDETEAYLATWVADFVYYVINESGFLNNIEIVESDS
jgi:hypothetical protein